MDEGLERERVGTGLYASDSSESDSSSSGSEVDERLFRGLTAEDLRVTTGS